MQRKAWRVAEVWLKCAEAARLTGWSKRHIRRVLNNSSRESETRGRNGRLEREYALSGLPAAAQLKYARLLQGPSRQTGEQTAIARANVLPLLAKAETEKPIIVALHEEHRDLAHARLEALEPLLEFRRRTNGHRPVIPLPDGRKVDTLNDLAEWIAAQQKPPVSMRTLYRWLDRFDKGGLAALGEAPRRDKGQSRYFAQHPLAAEFLRHKWLNEGLSAQMCWEALRRDWKNIGEPGYPPSYSAALAFINTIPEPIKVMGRQGKEAYERKCSPHVQRAPVDAMAWWVSDHRQFDVMVRNTLFAELKPDEPYRVWFTAILDWGSRKIVGWCFAPSPSSRTICSALRIAALSHGFPRNFYWDNGEDYKKVRRDLERIELPENLRSVLNREGVGITSALPYPPRSKPIEAHFTHWSKRFDVIWQQAYLGNKPGNRPEKARQAEALHQKYLKGQRARSPLPTDAEFILAAMQAIEDYNDKPHRSLQHRSPNEVMEEQFPECRRTGADPRLVDLLFCEREIRTVRQGGCVQLDQMIYEPDDASLFAMDLRKGQDVLVLRDPYNLGEATAADPKTLQFVGSLRVQELVSQAPGGRVTRDQINAGMRKQRSLRKGYAEYLAALGAMATSMDWKSEREELVARALENTGTDGIEKAAPGMARAQAAALPAGRQARAKAALQPAFISDAVAEDAEIFREIRTEE